MSLQKVQNTDLCFIYLNLITNQLRLYVIFIIPEFDFFLPLELLASSFSSEASKIGRFVIGDHVLLEDLLGDFMSLENLLQSMSFFGIAL